MSEAKDVLQMVHDALAAAGASGLINRPKACACRREELQRPNGSGPILECISEDCEAWDGPIPVGPPPGDLPNCPCTVRMAPPRPPAEEASTAPARSMTSMLDRIADLAAAVSDEIGGQAAELRTERTLREAMQREIEARVAKLEAATRKEPADGIAERSQGRAGAEGE